MSTDVSAVLSADLAVWRGTGAEAAGEQAAGELADEAGLLQAALEQFYQDHDAPPEIHVPVRLPESEALEAWLTGRMGRKVRIEVPQRGARRALVDLVARNAGLAYQRRFNPDANVQFEALDALRALIGLPALPRRIEAFDISTIQGAETVASMVVCEEGRMRPSEVPGSSRSPRLGRTTSRPCAKWSAGATGG